MMSFTLIGLMPLFLFLNANYKSSRVCTGSSMSTNVVPYWFLKYTAFYHDIGIFILYSGRKPNCFICPCMLLLMKSTCVMKSTCGFYFLLLNGTKLFSRWQDMLDQVLFRTHVTIYTIPCITFTSNSIQFFQ